MQKNFLEVAIMAMDGVQALDVAGAMDIFAAANTRATADLRPYRLTLVTPAGGEISTRSGLRLASTLPMEALPDEIDTLIIAGGSPDAMRIDASPTRVASWLKRRAAASRRVAGLNSGVRLLADAGLLGGRRATSHWSLCPLLQTGHPAITVDADPIFIAEPPFYTCAGMTAATDLCLQFVEQDRGRNVASAVAKDLVLFMRRPGGQSQISVGLQAQANAAPRLLTLLSEIVDQPAADLRGPVLADRVGMSERTFSRSFRKATGCTPARFVEAVRVERAKAYLESAAWPLARVAQRAGFGSSDALHRAFMRQVGSTPGSYREQVGTST
ncbi:GlxA family transcriptional regulator [Roseateles toxinivorans]|uniref:AraC family transcriptional regulator with amidase-like domain n=1 Tax=Roseateles toxinivorans TaxID=270368 RepID=A0A4V3CTQ3_9BURK|nr:helix-turn-helix domain-containing protein [Roseateles toxinivorans]TDP72974.1 AraC family transcriptional regulator with amidase-like domain [Roseateles toxinivorans]